LALSTIQCTVFFHKMISWKFDIYQMLIFHSRNKYKRQLIAKFLVWDFVSVNRLVIVTFSHSFQYKVLPCHAHTANNSEKKICPLLENEDFFLKISIFFLKTANYSPIWEKNAHFEKTIFCSPSNNYCSNDFIAAMLNSTHSTCMCLQDTSQ